MRDSLRRTLLTVLAGLAILGSIEGPAFSQAPDPKSPTLYVVGYAHLDTEWRWDYPATIREYLPKTMRTNFDLFEKYPHYVFNFSGANRYRMIKEYYPAAYEKVKANVAAGRWYPSGASMEENDVNSPSAESTIRQILYGTRWFRAELGRSSAEFMLPDGFGFPDEMLPDRIAYEGIAFSLGPSGKRNAATARGQALALPERPKGRVYILAASASGDLKATFKVGDKPVELAVQDWGGYIGQWDNRVWTTRQEMAPSRRGGAPRPVAVQDYNSLVPGFVKPAPVAWFASHRHLQDGTNDPYAFSYLFAYALEVPAGAATLTLPNDERIRVLAVTVSDEGPMARPAHPLFDTLQR
jgi:hypothetical protein